MNDDDTQELAARLRATSDVKEKAAIAGLARSPVKAGDLEMSCETCLYFLPHHSWCDRPELSIPVDPAWYCLFWRI